LRAEKPKPGEQKTVGDIPIPPEKIHHEPVDVVKIANETVDETRSDGNAEEEEQANSIEMNDMSFYKDKREIVDGNKKTAAEEAKEQSLVEKETADESPADEKKKEGPEADSKDALVQGEQATKETLAKKGESEEKDSSTTSGANEKADASEENAIANVANSLATESNNSDMAKESDKKKSPAAVGDEAEKAAKSNAKDDSATDKPTTETDEAPALKEVPETVEKSGDLKVPNGGSKSTAAEEGGDTEKEDDDSDVAVGKDDAAKLDQDLMLEDSDCDKDETSEATNRKVTVMFQKLLNLGGGHSSGQVSVKIADKDTAGKPSLFVRMLQFSQSRVVAAHNSHTVTPNAEKSETESAASATDASSKPIVPTIIQNGRQVCSACQTLISLFCGIANFLIPCMPSLL